MTIDRKLEKLEREKMDTLSFQELFWQICIILASQGISICKDIFIFFIVHRTNLLSLKMQNELVELLRAFIEWKQNAFAFISLIVLKEVPSRKCITMCASAIEYIDEKTPLLKVERNSKQFGMSVHHSKFQEITKDIAIYTGKGDKEKISGCELVRINSDVLIKTGEVHFIAIFCAKGTTVYAYCVRTTSLPTIFVEISQKTLNLLFKRMISHEHIAIKKKQVITLCNRKSPKPQQFTEKQERVKNLWKNSLETAKK